MTVLAILSFFLLLFLPEVENVESQEKEAPAPFFSEVSKNVKNTLKPLVSYRLRRMLLFAVYNGFEASYYMAVIPWMVSEIMDGNQEEQNRKTAMIMLAFGVAQCAGAYSMGRIATRFGARCALITACLLGSGTYVVGVLVMSLRVEFGFWWFLLAIIWALQDSAVVTNCSAIIVSRFEESGLALGAYSFVSNLSLFIGFLGFSQLIKAGPYILLTILIVVLFGAYISSTTFDMKFPSKNMEIEETVLEAQP